MGFWAFSTSMSKFRLLSLTVKRIRRDCSIGLPILIFRRFSMQQFLACNSCGNQIPIPELHQGDLELEFLDCPNCGERVSRRFEPMEIPETETHQELVLELELETEAYRPGDGSQLEEVLPETSHLVEAEAKPDETENETKEPSVDWSVLGAANPRRRQKEVSSIRKIVPPVLGGLAAFPIATLIMWYGFGKDIGSTGQTVSQYVPWIVPQKFRSRSSDFPRREFGSSGSLRSNSSRLNSTTQNTLPTLNRENPVVAEAASVSSKAAVDLPTPNPPESIPDDIKEETTLVPSNPALSETIVQLRTLQQEWETTPKAERSKMLQEYCAAIRQLSEQASQLKGRSAAVWRKDLEKIAREILAHANIPKAIQLGAIGKLTGVPSASTNDFIATIMTLGDREDPKPNAPWSLGERWPSHHGDLPAEVLAGAWRPGTTNLPATCLVFGQLVESEAPGSGLILRVHLILPQ